MKKIVLFYCVASHKLDTTGNCKPCICMYVVDLEKFMQFIAYLLDRQELRRIVLQY